MFGGVTSGNALHWELRCPLRLFCLWPFLLHPHITATHSRIDEGEQGLSHKVLESFHFALVAGVPYKPRRVRAICPSHRRQYAVLRRLRLSNQAFGFALDAKHRNLSTWLKL